MADLCPFDIKPLAQPRKINTVPIFNLSYTNQDYNSLKFRILELLKNSFGNDFNDFSESTLSAVLIELYCALADMLSFKIDQWGNEFFIDTVTELENAVRLAKLVGFKPLPPLPAKAMFSAKINSAHSTDIIIPAPAIVSLDGSGFDVVYELYPADINNNPLFGTPIIIPAGSLFTTAIVGLEGKTRGYTFNSIGQPNQVFTIPFDNVFYGSIKVDVDGVPWEEVESFTEHEPRREYIVEYDASYKPSIIFGNNKTGLIPINKAKINVRYRISGTYTSEIISNAFKSSFSVSLPGSNVPVVVEVTNYTKSEYGYPGDTIEDIRKKLPAYLRTQNRAVTGYDYKYLVDSFASPYNGTIGKCNIALRNHGCAGNVIDVIVLAKTGENRLLPANDNLKKELLDLINKKKMFTDYICIKDGSVVYVDVAIDLHLDKVYRRHENDIRNKVAYKLNEFFHLGNWEFGKSLKDKDLIKCIIAVKEIRNIDISFTTSRMSDDNNVIFAQYNEVIRPDNVSINFSYNAEE